MAIPHHRWAGWQTAGRRSPWQESCVARNSSMHTGLAGQPVPSLGLGCHSQHVPHQLLHYTRSEARAPPANVLQPTWAQEARVAATRPSAVCMAWHACLCAHARTATADMRWHKAPKASTMSIPGLPPPPSPPRRQTHIVGSRKQIGVAGRMGAPPEQLVAGQAPPGKQRWLLGAWILV